VIWKCIECEEARSRGTGSCQILKTVKTLTLLLVLVAPGHLLHFTMEATLPDAVDIRTLVTMLGGKEKIKYLEMNEVRSLGDSPATTC
jgi:hypothetical protein